MVKGLKDFLIESPGNIIYLLMGGFLIFIFIAILNSTFNPESKLNKRQNEERLALQVVRDDFQKLRSNPFVDSSILQFEKENIKTVKFKKEIFKIKGLFCLKKVSNNTTEPFSELNNFLRNQSIPISTSGDSLNFLVFVKYNYLLVGSYSNGGAGYRVETIINLLDLKNRTFYEMERDMGSDPPSTIKSKTYDKTSSGFGSRLQAEDIAPKLKKYFLGSPIHTKTGL